MHYILVELSRHFWYRNLHKNLDWILQIDILAIHDKLYPEIIPFLVIRFFFLLELKTQNNPMINNY